MEVKLSIIVPTFNRADLIGQTIESVLAQTSPDWEKGTMFRWMA